MKRLILLLIALIFVYGCSQHSIIKVKGEVREPRTFTSQEILSLENSTEIVFWKILAASGCITGYAYDVVVYGTNGIKDFYASDAYKDNVMLVYNNETGFDLTAPGINLKNVYKIEVVSYDY